MNPNYRMDYRDRYNQSAAVAELSGGVSAAAANAHLADAAARMEQAKQARIANLIAVLPYLNKESQAKGLAEVMKELGYVG